MRSGRNCVDSNTIWWVAYSAWICLVKDPNCLLAPRSICQRKYDGAGFYSVFRMKVDTVSWLTEWVVFLLILHHFDGLTKKQRQGKCLLIALYYTNSLQSNHSLQLDFFYHNSGNNNMFKSCYLRKSLFSRDNSLLRWTILSPKKNIPQDHNHRTAELCQTCATRKLVSSGQVFPLRSYPNVKIA